MQYPTKSYFASRVTSGGGGGCRTPPKLEFAWAPHDYQSAACCIYILVFFDCTSQVLLYVYSCSLMQNFRHKNSGDLHQGDLHTRHSPASSQPARLVPRKTAVRQPASWSLPPSSCTAHCWTNTLLEPFVSCACHLEFDNDFLPAACWLAGCWLCWYESALRTHHEFKSWKSPSKKAQYKNNSHTDGT
jgi:hypothetical protein